MVTAWNPELSVGDEVVDAQHRQGGGATRTDAPSSHGDGNSAGPAEWPGLLG